MGICQQCIHYRRVKPASQLLAQAAATTDAAISNALTKIQEDETQQKGYEAQLRAKKENANDETWGFRPVMSGFCGLREDKLYRDIQEGKLLMQEGEFTSRLRELEVEGYLIAEVKNFGGRCQDFEAGQPVKRSCSTCAHRIAPPGTEPDRSRRRRA